MSESGSRDGSVDRNDRRNDRSSNSDRDDDRDRDHEIKNRNQTQLVDIRNKPLDESYRQGRWQSLLKSKVSFGFHHLSPAHLPSMSEDRHAYALCFEKVSNWSIPDSVLKAFGDDDFEITLQLSLSLYHLNSASFFGSTWMGPPISLGNSDRKIPKSIDFEYTDIVYMISRITDPTCVAVIEIVVSKFDIARNLIAMQFG
jgi:hypothetical protein